VRKHVEVLREIQPYSYNFNFSVKMLLLWIVYDLTFFIVYLHMIILYMGLLFVCGVVVDAA